MQAGRIWPWVVVAAAVGFLLAATVADARGGRSSGRMRGVVSAPRSTLPASSASPAANSAPAQAVQPDPPATKSKASSVNLTTVGTVATPPPSAAAAPVPQIAAPISQLGTIAPLSDTTAIPTAQVTGGSSGVSLSETPDGGRGGSAGVHGVLGERHTYDQGRMEGSLPTLNASAPRHRWPKEALRP
jgi:hypothetical protein